MEFANALGALISLAARFTMALKVADGNAGFRRKDEAMRKNILIALFGLLLASVLAMDASADSWPAWRGPNANGIAPNGDPPISWSETKNVKWKVELPKSGSSTPIVWGDKIFLTTAVPVGKHREAAPSSGRRRGPNASSVSGAYAFKLICLDRLTGKVLWQQTATEATPHEGHHPTASFASYSPITDGEFVWASFGSRGLFCYDFDGALLWKADLIEMRKRMTFGEGASPALAGDKIIVVMDHQGPSKIAAFNKKSGEKVWETDRDEITSWATPFVLEVDGRLQVVTSATALTRAYDVETGDLVWQVGGMTANTIPSPVAGFGHVYLTSGFRGYALQAVRLGESGDLSGSSAITWQIDRNTPYVASPLLYGDRIYVLADRKAILSCYDARTGEPQYERQDLEGMGVIYASLVGASGKIYIAGREGAVTVVKHGGEFEVLATNRLDDGFDASPVVISDELYLRGRTYLYCIAEL
jgi:outer membrane protein assembly factor BamB